MMENGQFSVPWRKMARNSLVRSSGQVSGQACPGGRLSWAFAAVQRGYSESLQVVGFPRCSWGLDLHGSTSRSACIGAVWKLA